MKFVSQWVIIAIVISFFFSVFDVSAESKKIIDSSINLPKNIDISLSGSDLFEKGRYWALSYIDMKKDDELWVWKVPNIAPYAAIYYSDDDNTPSYLEYKIMCGIDDCWFVMINVDGNDTLIPEASVFWKTNSELLIEKNPNKDQKNKKLHRFGLFEQYISDDTDIISLDPRDKTNTPEKLKEKKIQFNRLKSTDEFKKIKESFHWSGSVEAANLSTVTYVAGATTNTYVPWASTFACPSRTPCYDQFNTTYNGSSCLSWCGPTAGAIIMGYHDMNSKPNLIVGSVASMVNDTISNGMILSIGASMQTVCTTNQLGSTALSNISNGIQYAKTHWYPSSNAVFNTNSLVAPILSAIQSEINAGRPALVTTSNHALVAYGYSNVTGSQSIRVNYGWGANYSNRDVTMTNVPVNSTQMSITWISRYVIQ